jgi:hypothetical protein
MVPIRDVTAGNGAVIIAQASAPTARRDADLDPGATRG